MKQKFLMIKGMQGLNMVFEQLVRAKLFAEKDNTTQYTFVLNVRFFNHLKNIISIKNVNFIDMHTYKSINPNLTKPIQNFDRVLSSSVLYGSCDREWNTLMVEPFDGCSDLTDLIKNISLNNSVTEKIKHTKHILLDNNYLCVHFRATDCLSKHPNLTIDVFENELKNIINTTKRKILLCTDSSILIKKYVDDKKVFCINHVRKAVDGGHGDLQCLHREIKDENNNIQNELKNYGLTTYDVVESSVIDFFLMICADSLIASKLGLFSKNAERVRNTLISTNNYENFLNKFK